jgi:hypothetical protein
MARATKWPAARIHDAGLAASPRRPSFNNNPEIEPRAATPTVEPPDPRPIAHGNRAAGPWLFDLTRVPGRGISMTLFGRLLYSVIAFTLMAAAILLICVAVWRTATGFWTGQNALESMLDGISLIIIAVAVADVGKFLFEEEVLSDRELRRPAEARGSLTKFMTIIIIALHLEALVLIAKTSRETMGDIVYPGLLVFLAATSMVGLGLFQKLSQNATAIVPPDRTEANSDKLQARRGSAES